MTVRPPIVVVLGHVDHGKSSLLEAIRDDFAMTSKESGGITQHIGAYAVRCQGKSITFIDTPGHEAFSAMRSRGAHIADIAVLVVASDEGIQPQTKEAVEVIEAAKIPFVVAFNKIDKPEADVEKMKGELAKINVFVESFGGKTPSIETSAKTKQGIKELLEMILLMADMEDLTADFAKPGEGVIIESSLDPQRGVAVTLLLRNGNVKVGDIVGTKSCFGKVQLIEDGEGKPLEKMLPSVPALVVGFEQSPRIGEECRVFESEERAKEYLAPEETLENVPQALKDSSKKVVPVIIKADMAGSLEVIEQMLSSISKEDATLKVIGAGVGEINDADARLAQGTKAIIFGFKTKINRDTEAFAMRENISIQCFDIVYDLIQKAREIMEQPHITEIIQKEIGTLRVLGVFFTEKNKQIVGGRVLEGQAQKGAKIEISRNNEIAGRGKVMNLQKDKKDMPMVKSGEECGISYEGDSQVQEGDILHFFIEERV